MLGILTSRLAPVCVLPLAGISIIVTLLLGNTFRSLAQTVGQDIVIRDNALPGTVFDFTAAFEPGATYVAWRDTRNNLTSGGDIYAQKIGPDGIPLWALNGLPVCTANDNQLLPAIAPDGTGGAVVVWLDQRGDSFDAIAGQRISASGAVQWTSNGELIGVVLSSQPRPFVHRAPDGGFLVTWWDAEPFFNPDDDMVALLAQKLDPDGVALWDAEGPWPVDDVWGPGIEVINGILRGRSVPDATGGIIAFGKLQYGRGFRFQRVAADQSMPWPAPVDFAASLDDIVPFSFAADGAGGVVVVYRVASILRGFRVTGDGAMAWGAAGIDLVTSNLNTAQIFAVTGDGQGGAFVAWIASSPRDVRVQRFSANGAAQWAAEGVIVPDLTASETDPALIPDGRGGIFLSFDTITSVRGQRLDSSGTAQWFAGGSNGLNLGVGNDPVIGAGVTGPIVVYSRSSGLFARTIEASDPTFLQLTSFMVLSPQTVTMSLNGGAPNTHYEVLRATSLRNPPSDTQWTIVGTIQPGNSWTDNNPPFPSAVYLVREPAP